jgi:N-acetylmuramoyl-L-alanine amidase
MPEIFQIPSPNFAVGREGAICAIVEHIMQGTLSGTDAWFQNPASQLSSHYGIGRSGVIHKYVGTRDQAWHAGVVDRPRAGMVLQNPTANPNMYTIGIEHEGLSGDTLTPAQYASTLWLQKILVQAYFIPVDEYHILRHSDIDADHAGCPGPGFPMGQLIKDLQLPA